MIKLPTVLLAVLSLVWTSSGQVTVELLLDQEQYLRDESILIKARVVNRSGQMIHLGQDNDWLNISVERTGGAPVARSGQVPLKGAFNVESAQMATREVDIQPWFDLSEPGRYTVAASLRLKQWDQEVSAKPKTFEVVRGTKLWEHEVGVPSSAGSPETRRFILQQANYRKQLKLYARISNNDDSYAYRLIQLGSVVSFGRPEAQVDRESNWHVLFQTGARSFSYSVLDPNGTLLSKHTYDYTATRPSLRTKDGVIFVAGGSRRMTPTDLPASSSIPSSQEKVNATAPRENPPK